MIFCQDYIDLLFSVAKASTVRCSALKRQARCFAAVTTFERDRFQPGFGGENGAVLITRDQAQSDNAGEIIDCARDIRRGEGRMPGAFDLQHRQLPFLEFRFSLRKDRRHVYARAKVCELACALLASCARTAAFSSPSIGLERHTMMSPGLTGPTPSGVPV